MKIYIVEHQTNGEYELPITKIEHVFNDCTKAAKWLDNKKSEIESHTSHHFTKDNDPTLDYEYSRPQIHIVNAATYKWTDTESGKPMYTHFKILEYEVE